MLPTTPTTREPGRVGVGVEAARAHALAERVLARPQLRRERLVHDDDSRLVARVVLVEEPARDERDPHRLEVAASHDADVGVDEGLAGRGRAPLHRDRAPRHHLAQRQRRDAARGAHAGQRREALPELPVGLEHGGGLGVARTAHRELEGQHALRVEAGRHPLDAREAAHEQARADEQDDRERDLAGHEQAAQPVAPREESAARRRAARALGELGLQLGAALPPRRHEAEQRSPTRPTRRA